MLIHKLTLMANCAAFSWRELWGEKHDVGSSLLIPPTLDLSFGPPW